MNYTAWEKAELPEQTATYSPIGHLMLIQMLTAGLEKDGLKVIENRVKQSLNGEEISGHMVVNGQEGEAEFRHMVAYTNSYNKRVPIRIVSGAEVFVCLNGMVVGEVISLRKHTGLIVPAVSELVTTAVGKVREEWIQLNGDVQVMKEIELTRRLSAELIGRLFAEEKILTSREASLVVKEFNKPSFEAFKENNLWSLYNHCTYALKEARVDRKITKLKQLHDFSMDFAAEMLALPY